MPTDRDSAPPRLAFSLPLEPTRLLRARHRIRDYRHSFAVDEETIDDVVLAIEEAMSNAVRHSGAGDPLQINVHFQDRDLHVVVLDHGCGFDASGFQCGMPADPLSPGGRGLPLIRQLMDEMEACCRGGTEVRAVKRDCYAVREILAVGSDITELWSDPGADDEVRHGPAPRGGETEHGAGDRV